MEKKCIRKLLEENEKIFQEKETLQKVLDVREYVKHLFKGLEVSVSIGGSYALKYWDDRFAEHPVHDYDIIVTVISDKEYEKAKSLLNNLVSLGWLWHKEEYREKSYHFEYNGNMKIDILLDKRNNFVDEVIQSPDKVIAAKKKYVLEALRENKVPRLKDILDISKYEQQH